MEASHAGQKTIVGTKRARERYGCPAFVGVGTKCTSDEKVHPREVGMLSLTYLSLTTCSH